MFLQQSEFLMFKKIKVFLTACVFMTGLASWNCYAEPHNLGILKAKLVYYYDSGAYRRAIEAVALNATHYINAQTKINSEREQPKKLAMVLDIDETSLSNYPYMRASDFSGQAAQVRQAYLAADAPAIQPILALYQQAMSKGIAVFFITGRDESLRSATSRNLRRAGYYNWAGLSMKPKNANVTNFKTSQRAAIEQQGYSIIASIGDQYSDLIGGYAQKTFKLPNPFYYIPASVHAQVSQQEQRKNLIQPALA